MRTGKSDDDENQLRLARQFRESGIDLELCDIHRIYFSPFDVNEYTVQFLFQEWRYTKKMAERQLK